MIIPASFNPNMIPGHVLWFEAGVADTVAGGFTTASKNLAGGSAGDITWPTVGRQPTPVANCINGYPGWNGGAVNGQGTTQPFVSGGPITVFAVGRPAANVGGGSPGDTVGFCALRTRQGGTNNVAWLQRSAGAISPWVSVTAGTPTVTQSPQEAVYMYDQPLIYAANADLGVSATPTAWINGSLQVTLNPPSVVADAGAGNFSIGLGTAGNVGNGALVRVHAFTRTLTSQEMAWMTTYLSRKYQILCQTVP